MRGGEAKGPIAKNLDAERLAKLASWPASGDGDAVFFVCDKPRAAARFAGAVRTRLGDELGLIEKDAYRFCWIVDFPMFELNEDTQQIDFSHNPFSMPQGGLEALETQDPLDHHGLPVRHRLQRRGAVLGRDPQPPARDHAEGLRDRRLQAEEVEEQFAGMLNAFRLGAPPHGGSAPGIDRIVMLLADEPNIREVILFPMNQQRRGPDDGGAGAAAGEPVARAAHQAGHAAGVIFPLR